MHHSRREEPELEVGWFLGICLHKKIPDFTAVFALLFVLYVHRDKIMLRRKTL
jgi:hypothetical protein